VECTLALDVGCALALHVDIHCRFVVHDSSALYVHVGVVCSASYLHVGVGCLNIGVGCFSQRNPLPKSGVEERVRVLVHACERVRVLVRVRVHVRVRVRTFACA
jgi:hypothetical protein